MELGLPVKPIAEYEFCEQVLACYEENQASRTDVIDVLNVIEIPDEAVVDDEPAPAKPKSPQIPTWEGGQRSR